MNTAERGWVVAVAIMVTALSAANAAAQQPTPSSPVNPSWCSSAPASPPPPQFEQHPGDWTAVRQMCMNLPNANKGCSYICQTAKDLWNLQKLGRLKHSGSFPSPLPSGASRYVVPAHPAPTSSPTDALTSQSSLLSPGPFSKYPGVELNGIISQPPDVAAAVSNGRMAALIAGDSTTRRSEAPKRALPGGHE